MKGKLTTNLSLTANTSIPKVVHEGGASTWNEITGKPFSTVDTENGLAIYDNTLMIDTLDKIATIDYVDGQIDAVEAEIPSLSGYATENYVDTAISNIPDPDWSDVQNKPTFATVATSGDYDDLDNKPTIPQADGTTIIDNNGVFSATASGVNIDNKSIIKNADDELQEAVPLYSEVIITDVGDEGLLISNYRGNGTTDGDFYLDTNENQLTFVSESTGSNDYYKVMLAGENGWIIAKWRNTVSITFNAVIESASSNFSSKVGQQIQVYYRYQQDANLFPNGNHYGVKFHIYSANYLTPYSQWTNMSIYPTEAGITAGDTLETQAETLGLTWGQGQWSKEVVHKLPDKYLNIKADEITYSNYYPMLYNDANGDIRATRLGPGTNISFGSTNLSDGTRGYQINCTLQPSPIGGNYHQNGSYGFYGSIVTIDSTHWCSFINVWSGFYNNSGWGPGDYIYETGYVGGNYGLANPFKMTGLIHVGTTIDDVSIEGFETIIDHVSYNSSQDRLGFYFKDGIRPYNPYSSIYKYIGNVYKDIQRVNSIWLPLDNSTIVRDTTNGNIKTAIPAPPTTDGTYTLQATVSSGVVTYSWI